MFIPCRASSRLPCVLSELAVARGRIRAWRPTRATSRRPDLIQKRTFAARREAPLKGGTGTSTTKLRSQDLGGIDYYVRSRPGAQLTLA